MSSIRRFVGETAAVDRTLSMAEKLDDEAESQLELGTPFNRAVAAALRAMAEAARGRGLATAEEFNDHYPGGFGKI